MTYIPGRLHPPVASAVVEIPEWDPTHVYAWKPANNYKGWKLIDRGEAGVDDASVINQAALEVKNTGGGVLKITSGTYKISEPIQLIKNVDYIGEGAEKTMLSAAVDDINILEGVEKILNQTFKGFSLYASSAKATAIDLKKGASRCLFVDINAYFAYPGYPLTGYHGLILRGVDPDTNDANSNQYGNEFINCRFQNFDINIYLYGQDVANARCNANKFLGGLVGNGNKNIYINGHGNVFVGMILNPTATGSYYIYAEGTGTHRNCCFGCYFEGVTASDTIYMDTPSGIDAPAVSTIWCVGIDKNNITDVNNSSRKVIVDLDYNILTGTTKITHNRDANGFFVEFPIGTPSTTRELFAVGDPNQTPKYIIYWYRSDTGKNGLRLGAKWCPVEFREVYRADYGGNFANFTPPDPAGQGHIFFAEDTNSTNPAKRLYVSLDGSTWSYVDLT